MTEHEKNAFISGLILNPLQREAVEYQDGPQLVFAGAGTGKTRVLTAKIAWLIRCAEYAPDRIFAATFTNKAAREMQSRVESLLNLSCKGLWIGTFHSLCVRILRREAARLGYTPGFTIYDTDDQKSLLKKVMKELDLDERAMNPATVLHVISRAKNRCLTPDHLAESASSYLEQEQVRVYRSYQEALVESQAMDFDDLIANTVHLFSAHPSRLALYRDRFRYLLVDEYQDTNLAQFYLVRALAGENNGVFAVGDDDQSIYGWRGAEVANILSFEKVFPGTRVFKLEQNYRSTPSILDFANAVISSNPNRSGKSLWTSRPQGVPVRLMRYPDDRAEAEGIADAVAAHLRNNVPASNILILFRTNAQSRPFEETLRRRGISYILVGGTSFYQRKEVKDCLAFLRLAVNPGDTISFLRVVNTPPRGIGKKGVEQILHEARKGGLPPLAFLLKGGTVSLSPKAQSGLDECTSLFATLSPLALDTAGPDEILAMALEESGYMRMLEDEDSEESNGRIENINELLNVLARWRAEHPEGTTAAFLEEMTLAADVDTLDDSGEGVVLMTLHSAKGLEAPYVYLAGLEDGILPSRQNFDDDDKIEEERRLLYVGITRAMKELHASYADVRWRFGAQVPMDPTRFLDSVPTHLYQEQRVAHHYAAPLHQPRPDPAPRPATVRAHQPRQQQPRAQEYDEYSQETVQLRMGQHVRHPAYGIGRILSISGFGHDMRLSVLFNNGSRKKMMAKFANLEILSSGSTQ